MTISPTISWSDQSQTSSPITAYKSPPAPKFERIPKQSPSANHVWVKGFWNWDKDKWKWNKGKFILASTEKPPINNPEYRSTPPSPHHVWIPGKWTGSDGDWSWSSGHYVKRPFINASWKPGHWEYRRAGWVWIPGHW